MATKAELEEQLAELEGECESLEKKLAKAEAALVKAKEKAKEKADEPKGPSFDQACSCPATLVLRAQKQSFGVKLVALSVKAPGKIEVAISIGVPPGYASGIAGIVSRVF